MYREDAIGLVVRELDYAQENFPPFYSLHEGYAIILEELDELWEVVKTKKPQHPADQEYLKKEAKQVAAMAIRFLMDLCDL